MQLNNDRGFALAKNQTKLVKYMDSINELMLALRDLQSTWNNLSLLGEVTQIGTDISTTRQSFQNLASQLSAGLIEQSTQKVTENLGSKAQCSIDILVRNLFERTADIGFLATDDVLRTTCLASNRHALDEATRQLTVNHLTRYVSNYSVYKNVLLLDINGKLILDMLGAYQNDCTLDWIKNGVQTATGYFETLGKVRETENREYLVYACAIRDNHQTIGYVALLFNMAEESNALFEKLVAKGNSCEATSCMVCGIMTADGTVLMSSDENHIPTGHVLNTSQGQDWSIMNHGPNAYMACIRATRGYQGYQGPGWLGFAMVPASRAFEDSNESESPALEVNVDQVAALISTELLAFPCRAKAIQLQLNRSVWNGNIAQRSSKQALGETFSKALLWEISSAGDKTRLLIHESLCRLGQTIFEAAQNEQRASATLAIDLMDRNLYERANDCRWWALSPTLRQALQNPKHAGLLNSARQSLCTINDLYTVYTNILLIDRQGKVICCSREADWEGKTLDAACVEQALALRNPEHYAVSDFEATPLYANRPTYMYCGAVFEKPEKPDQALGAVVLVFDSEPQFEAILNESTCGQGLDSMAFVVDQKGLVISSNTNRFIENGKLQLAFQRMQFRRGQSHTEHLELDGKLYAIGICHSSGYREYKDSNCCYQNNLSCIYGRAVGKLTPETTRHEIDFSEFRRALSPNGTLEIATFRSGNHWMGLPSDDVLESFTSRAIASMPNAPKCIAGTVLHRGRPVTLVDLKSLLNEQDPHEPTHTEQQIVLLKESRTGDQIGLIVDQLGEIPNVPVDLIQMGTELIDEDGILGGLVHANRQILSLIDLERLTKKLANMSHQKKRPQAGAF